MPAKLLHLCPTLGDPMNCSPTGSSVHVILQGGILEWVAMPFFRGSSRPRNRTRVSYISCFGRRVLYQQCHLKAHEERDVPLIFVDVSIEIIRGFGSAHYKATYSILPKNIVVVGGTYAGSEIKSRIFCLSVMQIWASDLPSLNFLTFRMKIKIVFTILL